jgi:hypothetical protein
MKMPPVEREAMANSWEYWVESMGNVVRGPKPTEIEDFLNQADEDGWEFVQAMKVENSNRVLFYMRKQILSTKRKRRSTWP